MELKASRETTPAPDPFLPQPINDSREGLEELFSRHRFRLYKTALRLVGNRDDAEDALQDGLLAAFRSLSGFEGRSQFSTWLTRIVINAALIRGRQNRSKLMISIDQNLEQDDHPLARRIPDPGLNPEEMYARQEQLQLLERALQTMPEIYRQAVWFRHVQGLKVREAAEVMGLRAGTLKSQLRRARLWLRRKAAEARPAHRVNQSSREHPAINRDRLTVELTEEITEPAT